MKRLVTLVALLLLTTPLLAQEVKLPSEVRGMAGAWIPVKPEIVSGGKPKWRVDPALQEIDLEDFFGPEAAMSAKGRIFQCTNQEGGRFKVECWNAAGDVPSDIATCWIIVTGIVPPAPVPPPSPTPTPPGPTPPTPEPPSPPVVAGPKAMLLVHESSQKFQPWTDTLNLLRSGPSADYLNSKSHSLNILDTDELGAGGKPSKTLEAWRPHFKDMKLPVLIIFDPKTRNILGKVEVPQTATDSDILAILKAHGG